MKKKLLFCLLFGGMMATANAQQLPNYGFDSWKGECGSTEAFGYSEGMRQRPGVEPIDWNGSSINQKVVLQKKQELIYNDNGAVKMVNTYVGAMGVGSVAPGFINLGTPWVYAVTKVNKCDGGVYGGMNFSYKPDAITGRYKRTDTTGEKSHIIVYLWNGTFSSKVGEKDAPSVSRDNVDRAIMGKSTTTSSGTLIASCDYEFTATTNKDWQTITVPLTYANASVAPTMMNTIISGGDYWDRSVMKENTTLYADDVRFVYYSTLKTLSYNGSALTVPAAGATLDMSSVVYDPAKLAYTLNGQTAEATTSYNDNSGLLTITVSNVDNDIDGLSSHTYYIQFAHVHGNFKYTANGAGITVACGKCGESLGTISMVLPTDLIYSGKAKAVTLTGAVEGMDAPAIVYNSGSVPVNVGTYTASITMGDATATVEFAIKAKDIAGATVGKFAAMTYNGKAQTPAATVTVEGIGEVAGAWSAVTNVTDKTSFTANGNFTGTISGVATGMQTKDVAGATVGEFAAMTYNGKAQTPVATVTIEGIGEVTGAWSAVTNVTDKTAFTANGNYTGTIANKVTGMQTKDIAGAIVGEFAAMTYTGKAQTPVAVVTLEGFGIVTGSWSEVTNVMDETTFTASGNYAGSISNVACDMQAKDIADAVVGEFAPMTYTGEPQTPVAAVTLDGFGEVTGVWSEVVTVADKTTFTANGNYVGTLKATPGMAPKAVSVVGAGVEDVAYDADGAYTFVVTNVVLDGADLVAGTDYTATAQLAGENAEGATVEVLITFTMLNANYVFDTTTWTATVNLLQHEHEWEYTADGATIQATCKDVNENCPTKVATITLQAPLDVVYSGEAKKVALTGSYPGLAKLEELITYSGDCINVGTYTATIAYGGVEATIEFAILPKDITDEAVAGEFAPMTYTGESQTPAAVVTLEGYGEVTGTWSEVVNVDDVATFTADGNFTGTISANTNMAPLALTEVVVEGIVESYEFTGSAIEPAVKVMNGETLLVEGVDYVVAYSDNVEAGMASVIVTFVGNYSGTMTLTFEIIDTAIKNILMSGDKVCYDLYGRRVLEPLKGEIYIVNGKKVRW